METPRPQTPAERMRDACVDDCVQWEEVFRGRGELDMAGAAKTCARDVGGIPIPTPTPLELARERFIRAAREFMALDPAICSQSGGDEVTAFIELQIEHDELVMHEKDLLRAEKEASGD